MPLDERLALYIREGSKDGLAGDLDEALQHRRPLEIVNGPLMAGMDEVGRKDDIVTVEADGKFRDGALQCCGASPSAHVTELIKVA